MQYQLSLGQHDVRFEEPDLLWVAVYGDLSAEETRRLAEYTLEVTEHREHLLVLADLSGLGEIPSEARREMAARTSEVPYRGMAFFGGSFQARLIAKLVVGAMNVFSSRSRDNPICFFEGEAEARAWIEERRGSLRGGQRLAAAQ